MNKKQEKLIRRIRFLYPLWLHLEWGKTGTRIFYRMELLHSFAMIGSRTRSNVVINGKLVPLITYSCGEELEDLILK